MMKQLIRASETKDVGGPSFACPTCHKRYTALEAQRLLTKNYKFVCSHCCPHDNFRSLLTTEAFYTLVEVDDSSSDLKTQGLRDKMDAQLSYCKIVPANPDGANSNHNAMAKEKEIVLHKGIYQLLEKLKDVALPRNLPSDNIYKGDGRTEMNQDEDSMAQLQYNLDMSKTNKTGGSFMNKKALDAVKARGATIAQHKTTVEVRLLSDDSDYQPYSGSSSAVNTLAMGMNLSNAERQLAVQNSLPMHLRGSHVIGAANVLQAVESTTAARDGQKLHDNSQDEDEVPPAKRVKIDSAVKVEASQGSTITSKAPEVETQSSSAAETAATSAIDEDDDLMNAEWEED